MQRAMTGCIAGRLKRPSSEETGRNSSKEPGSEDISEKDWKCYILYSPFLIFQ